MMLRQNNAKATVFVVGLLVLGAYLTYTSFQFEVSGPLEARERL